MSNSDDTSLDEMVSEMWRKPDPHVLLEWLANRAEAGSDVDVAADAYFRSLDEQSAEEDFHANLRRIDPPTCGCTDCITGYSMPLDMTVHNPDILARLVAGELQNASMWDPAGRESAEDFVRDWIAVNER